MIIQKSPKLSEIFKHFIWRICLSSYDSTFHSHPPTPTSVTSDPNFQRFEGIKTNSLLGVLIHLEASQRKRDGKKGIKRPVLLALRASLYSFRTSLHQLKPGTNYKLTRQNLEVSLVISGNVPSFSLFLGISSVQSSVKARFKHRTFYVPSLMQISKNNSFCSFAWGLGFVKFDV